MFEAAAFLTSSLFCFYLCLQFCPDRGGMGGGGVAQQKNANLCLIIASNLIKCYFVMMGSDREHLLLFWVFYAVIQSRWIFSILVSVLHTFP